VSRLAVYLLGPPRIERDGVTIKLDRRKAMALLAYLAATGLSHRRDSLVNLLWPDYDTTRGRAALRRTLHALSTALGSDYLDSNREEIGLKPGDDLRRAPLTSARDRPGRHSGWMWRSSAATWRRARPTGIWQRRYADVCGPLSEAVALVHGEFLSGFGLKDSFEFDDWQLFQAEALRRELAGALDRLIRYHSARRQFESAIGYARHRLGLDPLDEPTHQQLMRLYAWSGRRSAALSQYKECVAVLNDQLGVPPQDATRRLHEEIQAGHAPPLPTALDSVAELPPFLKGDQPVERPVFVARQRELAQLDGYLDLALAGHGRVVFVTGEAGSGKTALIQEFTRRAQEVQTGAWRDLGKTSWWPAGTAMPIPASATPTCPFARSWS